MGMEKRTSGRVEDCLPIEYRAITEAEYGVLEPQYRLIPTRERSASPTIAAGAGSADERVVGLLRDLDRKMDRVIELLTRDTAQGSSPVESVRTEQATCVDISGTGLRMVGGRRFSAGEFLDILISHPGSAPFSVGLLAKTVRDSVPAGSQYDTAVTFAAIDEEDREQLIAYVFQRQRQTLASRWGQT